VERVLFAPRDLPPLRPDAAADLPRYRRWLAERRAERLATGAPPPPGAPEIDVVVVVDRADPVLLGQCLTSVTGQTTGAWRLKLAVIGPAAEPVEGVLAATGAGAGRGRLVRTSCPVGTAMADAVAAALALPPPAGAFLVLGQHDLLAPDAVALLTGALCGPAEGIGADGADGAGGGSGPAALAYADEDRLGDDGLHRAPALKPGWSPDLLLSCPYLGRPVAVRTDAADAAGGIRALPDGDWEHDLLLRVTESTDRVAHVPEVLCHRRLEPEAGTGAGAVGGGGAVAGRGAGAVTEALHRRGTAHQVADVEPGPLAGTWSIRRRPASAVTVSVIVPFRDEPGFLRTCVDSVTATVGEVELDLVLVDNGSAEPETFTLLDRLSARPDVTVIHDPRPFNWAALNNNAAAAAGGEVLVFLNNDIDARRPGWLEALAAHALRPDVGAVGARLLYPTGRVQHVGVVIGMGGAAGHVLAGLPGTAPGYLGMAVLTRDTAAVTGACLATRREVFTEVGGFDEGLGLDLNDIDYCLQAGHLGYRVVFEPLAELVHHESPSRGTSGSVANISQFIDRWESLIRRGDRHLNPHLTRVDSSCALRDSDEEGWWRNWRSSLEIS
jgi:GT2 family glycosyltransferase